METPFSSSKLKSPVFQQLNSSPNSYSPSPSRQWRPAAQRNIRNQWSHLASSKQDYFTASYEARSHATSLVNAYLSQKYIPDMDLGVLKDMPGIRENALEKLVVKQNLYRNNLVSSYKRMAGVVAGMVRSSCLMRCFLKVSISSSLIQFCDQQEDVNDLGDGGGIPVFSKFSVSNFEILAQELVDIFRLELNLKRLLVLEFLNVSSDKKNEQPTTLSWHHQIYPGESDDLKRCNMVSEKNNQPLPPQLKNWPPADSSYDHSDRMKSDKVLQVLLTSWIADVNIDMNRVHEIISTVAEDMQVDLS